MTRVVVKTKLLAAVARWAMSPTDNLPHLATVAFRDNRMVATDGHRMVIIPMEVKVPFAVRRDYLIGAAAAQDALEDRALRENEVPVIALEPEGDHVHLTIGERPLVRMFVPEGRIQDYVPVYGIDQNIIKETPGAKPPDGWVFNARYLAAIQEIADAILPENGVRCVAWGTPTDPVRFDGPGKSIFVIMPMRMMKEEAKR